MTVAIVTVFATGGIQRITAGFRGETQAVERTQASGAFRLSTYEQFFDLCEAVQNTEAQIVALETELATGPTAARETRIHSSLTAVRSNRSRSINSYNSLAEQEHREAFRDADLPERLDHDTKETKCA